MVSSTYPAYTENRPCQVYVGLEPWGSADPLGRSLGEVSKTGALNRFPPLDISKRLQSFVFTVADATQPDGGLKYEMEIVNPTEEFERTIIHRLGKSVPVVGSFPRNKNPVHAGRSSLPILYIQWGYGDPNDDIPHSLSKVHTVAVTKIDYSLKSGKEKMLKLAAVDIMTFTLQSGMRGKAFESVEFDILEPLGKSGKQFKFKPMSEIVSHLMVDFLQAAPGISVISMLEKMGWVLDFLVDGQIEKLAAQDPGLPPTALTESELKDEDEVKKQFRASLALDLINASYAPSVTFDEESLRDITSDEFEKFRMFRTAYNSIFHYLGIKTYHNTDAHAAPINSAGVPQPGTSPTNPSPKLVPDPTPALKEAVDAVAVSSIEPLIIPLFSIYGTPDTNSIPLTGIRREQTYQRPPSMKPGQYGANAFSRLLGQESNIVFPIHQPYHSADESSFDSDAFNKDRMESGRHAGLDWDYQGNPIEGNSIKYPMGLLVGHSPPSVEWGMDPNTGERTRTTAAGQAPTHANPPEEYIWVDSSAPGVNVETQDLRDWWHETGPYTDVRSDFPPITQYLKDGKIVPWEHENIDHIYLSRHPLRSPIYFGGQETEGIFRWFPQREERARRAKGWVATDDYGDIQGQQGAFYVPGAPAFPSLLNIKDLVEELGDYGGIKDNPLFEKCPCVVWHNWEDENKMLDSRLVETNGTVRIPPAIYDDEDIEAMDANAAVGSIIIKFPPATNTSVLWGWSTTGKGSKPAALYTSLHRLTPTAKRLERMGSMEKSNIGSEEMFAGLESDGTRIGMSTSFYDPEVLSWGFWNKPRDKQPWLDPGSGLGLHGMLNPNKGRTKKGHWHSNTPTKQYSTIIVNSLNSNDALSFADWHRRAGIRGQCDWTVDDFIQVQVPAEAEQDLEYAETHLGPDGDGIISLDRTALIVTKAKENSFTSVLEKWNSNGKTALKNYLEVTMKEMYEGDLGLFESVEDYNFAKAPWAAFMNGAPWFDFTDEQAAEAEIGDSKWKAFLHAAGHVFTSSRQQTLDSIDANKRVPIPWLWTTLTKQDFMLKSGSSHSQPVYAHPDSLQGKVDNLGIDLYKKWKAKKDGIEATKAQELGKIDKEKDPLFPAAPQKQTPPPPKPGLRYWAVLETISGSNPLDTVRNLLVRLNNVCLGRLPGGYELSLHIFEPGHIDLAEFLKLFGDFEGEITSFKQSLTANEKSIRDAETKRLKSLYSDEQGDPTFQGNFKVQEELEAQAATAPANPPAGTVPKLSLAQVEDALNPVNADIVALLIPQVFIEELFADYASSEQKKGSTALARKMQHPMVITSFPHLQNTLKVAIENLSERTSDLSTKNTLDALDHRNMARLSFGTGDSTITSFDFKSDERYLAKLTQVPMIQKVARDLKDLAGVTHGDLKKTAQRITVLWRFLAIADPSLVQQSVPDADVGKLVDMGFGNWDGEVLMYGESLRAAAEVTRNYGSQQGGGKSLDPYIRQALGYLNPAAILTDDVMKKAREDVIAFGKLFAEEGGIGATRLQAIFPHVSDRNTWEQNVITGIAAAGQRTTLKSQVTKRTGRREIITATEFDDLTDAGSMLAFATNAFFANRAQQAQQNYQIGLKVLGIPEMDTSWEIIRRRLLVDIHDARESKREGPMPAPHWLMGLYKPIKVKHTYTRSGYFTEFRLLKEAGIYD